MAEITQVLPDVKVNRLRQDLYEIEIHSALVLGITQISGIRHPGQQVLPDQIAHLQQQVVVDFHLVVENGFENGQQAVQVEGLRPQLGAQLLGNFTFRLDIVRGLPLLLVVLPEQPLVFLRGIVAGEVRGYEEVPGVVGQLGQLVVGVVRGGRDSQVEIVEGRFEDGGRVPPQRRGVAGVALAPENRLAVAHEVQAGHVPQFRQISARPVKHVQENAQVRLVEAQIDREPLNRVVLDYLLHAVEIQAQDFLQLLFVVLREVDLYGLDDVGVGVVALKGDVGDEHDAHV